MANLLDYSNWIVGTGGLTNPSWVQRTNTAENERARQENPWGGQSVVWIAQTDQSTGSSAYDGGFAPSPTPSVSHNNTYRFSIWINRKVYGGGGMLYWGIYSYNNVFGFTNNTRISDSNSSTNHYFVNRTFANLDDIVEEDSWKLFVGFVHDSSYSGSTSTDSGIYDTDGTTYANIDSDLQMESSTTVYLAMRVFMYNCVIGGAGDTSQLARQWHLYPRIDLVDGSEPTISQLIDGVDSSALSVYQNKSIIPFNNVYQF